MLRSPAVLMMCVVSLAMFACEKTPAAPVADDAKAPPVAPIEPKHEPAVEEAKAPAFEGAGSAGALVLLSFKAALSQDSAQVQQLVMPAAQQQERCPKLEMKASSKEDVIARMVACKEHFAPRLDGAQPVIDTAAKGYSPQLMTEDSAQCKGASVYLGDEITYQIDTPETGILQYIFKPGLLIEVEGKWWLAEAPDCFFNAPG